MALKKVKTRPSKGERLGWKLLSEIEPIRLTAIDIKGKRITGQQPNGNYLIP